MKNSTFLAGNRAGLGVWWPSINGRPASYIATTLKAFRADKKQATAIPSSMSWKLNTPMVGHDTLYIHQ